MKHRLIIHVVIAAMALGLSVGAGALMAVPLSVPLVNLAVPVVGAATFTHLFHALRRR